MSYLTFLRPHSVLLEFPADLFAGPNLPSEELRVPLNELSVGWRYCQKNGALCSGFDMQGNDLLNVESQIPPRLERFVHALLKRVKAVQPKSYANLDQKFAAAECGGLSAKNSETCDQSVEQKRQAVQAAFEELKKNGQLKGLPDQNVLQSGENLWQRRNEAMAKNICNYSRRNGGTTVVVIVGYEHRYFLRRLLRECPVTVRDPAFLQRASGAPPNPEDNAHSL